MSWKHLDITGENHQFLHYADNLLVIVSTVKIRSPYGSGEKGVSTQEDTIFLIIETNASGRVARGSDHLEGRRFFTVVQNGIIVILRNAKDLAIR